jgi:hypothetical protein
MSYQVSRNGQLYGPYTLEDLQRYVATGNVLPTDLATDVSNPDAPPNWVPVSQLLAASGAVIPTPIAAYLPNYALPNPYAGSAVPYPDPPNLNWGLCLLFGFLTCGIFNLVYDLIQVLWVKKVEPASKSLMYYLIFIAFEVLNLGGTFGKIALFSSGRFTEVPTSSVPLALLSAAISIGVVVMYILYRFIMRAELERHFNGPEPIGLRLNPIMTFFFGGLYFQYHFNRINEIKRGLRYRGTIV